MWVKKMVSSISNNTNIITKSSYENKSNSASTSTDDTLMTTLGKDTFEKSEELSDAEKEQVALEKLYNYIKSKRKLDNEKIKEPTEKQQAALEKLYNDEKNKTTDISEKQMSAESKLAHDKFLKSLESFIHPKKIEFVPEDMNSFKITKLNILDDDDDAINNAFDQLSQYERTSEGQKVEREYEKALKDEKSAEFQGKSKEELLDLSKNSYEKGMALYEHMSGISESSKQVILKIMQDFNYKKNGDLYQLITNKNDDLLSNNAKSYLNKLRTDNPDTAICINDSNNFSINSDYVGYYTCLDKNLFELMANNKGHEDIWSKIINNQYNTFDDVISDIYKSGDSTLASKFQTNIEDYSGKISQHYHS